MHSSPMKRIRAHPVQTATFIFSLPLPLRPSVSTARVSPLRLSIFARPHRLPCVRPPPFTRTFRRAPPPCATAASNLNENIVSVSEPVLRAVESLARQPRQTVADIAAAAGLPLSRAADEAVALAALTGAAIDVTDNGDLAYRFPPDIRVRLRARSLRASLELTWRRAAPALFLAARVAFGALLVVSIVVTFVAIAALSAAGRSDDDRRDSRSSSSFFAPRFFAFDFFDVMFYSRPYGYYQPRRERGDEMSFFEAVYSFVFGDGDPNFDLEERRWRAVGALIRANRGAVTAEQLAPLLNPPLARDSGVVDERFVLPALTRFQGHPEVTDDGDIIYVFPSFMKTGARGGAGSVEVIGRGVRPVVEKELTFTQAAPGQRALVLGLGLVNVFGVAVLGSKLLGAIPLTADAAALISLIKSIYPALCAYAASFVVFPVFRFLRQRRKNTEIQARNRAREISAAELNRGGVDIRRKTRAAEDFVVRGANVANEDVVYSSDKDIIDQQSLQDELADDFDRRLNA